MAKTKAQNAANQQRFRDRIKARQNFSAEKLQEILEEMKGEVGENVAFSALQAPGCQINFVAVDVENGCTAASTPGFWRNTV